MSLPEKQSQDSFRLLVETAGCMIVILRQNHSIAFFNSFAEQLTGYSSEEVFGQDYFAIFLPEAEKAGVDAEIQRVFAGGPPTQSHENAVRCRDGSFRWLEWNAQRLDDFEGHPGLLAVGHDITDRKQATEDLRQQEARLRAVLDTAVDGIITINERGIIQSVNSATERIFGYTADEMNGNNISMLMPSPYREEHDGYLANYCRTGEKKIIGIGRQVEAQRKDGTTFPCDLAVSEVPPPDKRLFTGILRDITEQKGTEERALQAERLAAIGQTVTGLAHESRNAFQRSQACLEMLALELEDRPDELELVDRTQRALDHLHKLYEEVRDYAAPIKLDQQSCDLAHLWRDAWSHLEVNRKEKTVKLRECGTEIDLSCNADWFAMGQVFRNILENAITACREPGVVEVCWRECDIDGKPALEVAIHDNGPGIAPANRDQVFNAFFTTKTKGTGLGMAIAQRIVEAHGGLLTLGHPASGAEFVVTLPR